ncbi:hypothetical protein Cgig2_016508 [Carnegiea gigantea]|uniref:Ubiquitin-like protease family profile domain-containing protein n=1 Tax=Carnegiea gigantea TaxID=171969 RepID=A0A9Q1GHJ3_9CARY|nr:hypothetical protein Cgig2_016508 [Carnegiea gigantea]
MYASHVGVRRGWDQRLHRVCDVAASRSTQSNFGDNVLAESFIKEGHAAVVGGAGTVQVVQDYVGLHSPPLLYPRYVSLMTDVVTRKWGIAICRERQLDVAGTQSICAIDVEGLLKVIPAEIQGTSGYECGVFVMMCMDILALKEDTLCFTQDDMRSLRDKCLADQRRGTIRNFPHPVEVYSSCTIALVDVVEQYFNCYCLYL